MIGTEILRGLVGSTVHGTAIEGQDDRDEMGVTLEPPEYLIGLQEFEQHIERTQPEGVRSGPGDLDLTVYSGRKYLRLAMAGNPSILVLLFVPDGNLVTVTDLGWELRHLAPQIVSRRAGPRFLGYLTAQKERMLGVRGGMHTNRPELVGVHGYDTKYAMHMLRLGFQGIELLTTGRITLPIPGDEGDLCRSVRRGEVEQRVVLETVAELEARLRYLIDGATLPIREAPDRASIDAWLISAYTRSWDDG